MAKFHGVVGYVEQVEREDNTGVIIEVATERKYYGDVKKISRRLEKGLGLNDDVTVSNYISVLADAYAYEHFSDIRYVNWMGVNWKVTNVEVQRPRLTLSLGGVWNGATAKPSAEASTDNP